MESEDIWKIAKFALNIVSENYKEEPWDCIIDNDERAIYEILNKYTKDKDEQNKIYGAFLHCQYLDCDKDIYGYVPKVINRLEKLGYKIIGVFKVENSIEDLKQRLQELYQTQQARLDVGADDLDIIEEISEVEAEIKELEDDINEENDNGRRHKCRRHRKYHKRRYNDIRKLA